MKSLARYSWNVSSVNPFIFKVLTDLFIKVQNAYTVGYKGKCLYGYLLLSGCKSQEFKDNVAKLLDPSMRPKELNEQLSRLITEINNYNNKTKQLNLNTIIPNEIVNIIVEIKNGKYSGKIGMACMAVNLGLIPESTACAIHNQIDSQVKKVIKTIKTILPN